MKLLPIVCPACGRPLSVRELVCGDCGTEVEGLFEFPQLARLSAQEQAFVLEFVKAGGSLKQMAKLLKLSYPTVRNMLDDIIAGIRLMEKEQRK